MGIYKKRKVYIVPSLNFKHITQYELKCKIVHEMQKYLPGKLILWLSLWNKYPQTSSKAA